MHSNGVRWPLRGQYKGSPVEGEKRALVLLHRMGVIGGHEEGCVDETLAMAKWQAEARGCLQLAHVLVLPIARGHIINATLIALYKYADGDCQMQRVDYCI